MCCSSGVIWEQEKSNRFKTRFKPFKTKHSLVLEEAYQKYLNEVQVEKDIDGHRVLEGKMEVSFLSLITSFCFICIL